MRIWNQTTIKEFILLGLSDDPNMQIVLFHLFYIAYMSILAGNGLLIMAVKIDRRLQTSMYIFLCNLSFMDICLTSVIVPKMLVNMATSSKSISFSGCIAQVFCFLLLGETECAFLAFMAYDRFVAICNPLRYNVIMNKVSCIRMISISWVTGSVMSLVDIVLVYQLRYCGPVIINHFFCESTSLLQLSCSDLSTDNIVTLVGSSIFLIIPISLILFSYVNIFFVIVKLRSGKYKAFSTCVSHLIVVVIFYGTAMFMYLKPRYSDTEVTDKMVSVFYTIVTPMLNPVIYSLRNKDVQKAIVLIQKKIRYCSEISF